MLTEVEIKAKYKKLHDELSEIYYNQEPEGQLSKEDFDQLHGQIWSNMDAELITGGYKTIPEPQRDLIAEIDDLKARLEKLEPLSPQ